MSVTVSVFRETEPGRRRVARRPRWLRRTASAAARVLGVAGLAQIAMVALAAAVEWPAISPGERTLQSVDPQGPGAIILFEEALVDDRVPGQRLESVHRRIKILTPAGLGWASVTVGFAGPRQRLTEVEGRTVRPDGTEASLNPSSVDRSEGGAMNSGASFRLPDAAVGAILEYRYVLLGGDPPDVGGWVFQHEVPCQRSTLTWRPSLARTSRWTLLGTEEFDPVVEPVYRPDAPDSLEAARFELRDLPSAVDEPFGPPALEARPRVVTSYSDWPLGPRGYWAALTQALRSQEEAFASGRTAVAARLRAIPPATDDMAGKIRHAYEFAQAAVTNLAARGEPAPPTPSNADSLLAAGVTGLDGVHLLFIAALAEYGIPATRALVVERDRARFHPDILTPAQFTSNIVAIRTSPGQYLFLAPGVPFCPPGLLPWRAQGVTALVAGDSTALFLPTPVGEAFLNRTLRRLDLQIDAEGQLAGRADVSLTGQPELEARQLLGRSGIESLRRHVEQDWSAGLAGVQVDSFATLHTGDSDRDLGFRARLRATVPIRRVEGEVLFNAATVARIGRNPLGEGPRVQPVSLDYPRVDTDEARFKLPPEWRVESLPEPVTFQNAAGEYRAVWFWDGGSLQYQRTLALTAGYLPVRDAGLLRELLEQAVQGDATLVSFAYRPLRPSQRN